MLFFCIFCLNPWQLLPASLQRAMKHQFDQIYGHLVFHHPEVARGHHDIAGVGVEMRPKLEGKMRGSDHGHKCISPYNLFVPAA